MNRASSPQLRNAMRMADAFVKAGILFVPVPVMNEADFVKLITDMNERLLVIESSCET